MERRYLKKLLLTSAAVVFLFASGCATTAPSTTTATETTAATVTAVTHDYAQDLRDSLSEDSLSYLKDPDAITVQELPITLVAEIRLTIPDAIPMIAEELFPAFKRLAKEAGSEKYRLELVSHKVNGTEISWKTIDGKSGIFTEGSSSYTLTLNELYAHFNDYGRD